jgi:N-acetylneuraminic acid mutarotase
MPKHDRRNISTFVETLEPRQLMAFSAHINFQPSGVTIPSGYVADTGATYASRNGLTYGWDADNSANARDKNSSLSKDQRYDTLNHMQRNGSRKWEISVPNGTYSVHVVAGDAGFYDSVYKINAEGTLTVSGTPTSSSRWVEGTKTVTVSDGRLTISNASGASNNKICFIDISQTTTSSSTKINWTKGSPTAPISRVESGTVQIGSKVYIIGGYTGGGYDATTRRMDIYDINTGSWSRGTDLPSNGTQTHAGVATDGKYIYWAGGQNGPLFSLDSRKTVWRYNLSTKQWSTWISLPDNRYGGALAYIASRNELHYFGGDLADRHTATSTHWVIDLDDSSPSWKSKAALPRAADHLGHVVINNQVYLLGGEHDHGVTYQQHNNVYRYDPATDTYKTLASMPLASSHFEGAVSYLNGKIFVMAGQIDDEQLTSQVRAYDLASNTWTIYSSLPEKRKGGVSWIKDNKLYYNGGDAWENGQPTYTWIGTFA